MSRKSSCYADSLFRFAAAYISIESLKVAMALNVSRSMKQVRNYIVDKISDMLKLIFQSLVGDCWRNETQ